ncbi:glycogen-binding domain-containing protein [Candidatus Avelusimicrobium caledoniensis]|uniref:glycogen-binding domain-containing protein n=1 Tax=Candidatus Avelusimicrobium caledoniensis TaxID=3416220 RepID=UPI003D0C9787
MPKIKRPGVFFAFFLFLMALTLTWFFVEASDYYDYTANAIENTASIAPLNKESLLARQKVRTLAYDTEVKYRKFYITVPGAQKVELAADFNRWGQDPIELKAYRKGYFETSVALTAGEYKYVFVVDGDDVLDPMNEDRQTVGGRRVCIKTVK